MGNNQQTCSQNRKIDQKAFTSKNGEDPSDFNNCNSM